tara:strand:+ start:2962 stop:4083 length:1122 start_codon:yes stop_codon:yes gene_type:complete
MILKKKVVSFILKKIKIMQKEKFDKIQAYGLNKKEKKFFFESKLKNLIKYHYKKSKQYRKILNYFNYDLNNKKLEKMPFLPTQLFKEIDLISVKKNKIIKTLMSSGTSGSNPSKIYLDKDNSYNQIVVLSKIISSILGSKRLPMLIIDKNPVNLKRNMFNAKVAAINGFSIFGLDHTYLLKDEDAENINYEKLQLFLKRNGDKPFFIFGFTSNVYKLLIEKFNHDPKLFDFSNGILLHGGGWKRMENRKIGNKTFKDLLKKKLNLKNIFNYYGLVEQTGSIFLECKKCSCFRTSVFSDVLIRDKHFNILKNGKKGLIQLFSLLPSSYPGHSILTEDVGEIVEGKECECSNKGKRFRVYGRSKKSEIRGCSDTI